MPVYIAPKGYLSSIETYLLHKYPGKKEERLVVDFCTVKKIVLSACESKTETQPSVKLLSAYDSLMHSAWFGTVLHHYGDFNEMLITDHTKSKFLFHGSARSDPWEILMLT